MSAWIFLIAYLCEVCCVDSLRAETTPRSFVWNADTKMLMRYRNLPMYFLRPPCWPRGGAGPFQSHFIEARVFTMHFPCVHHISFRNYYRSCPPVRDSSFTARIKKSFSEISPYWKGNRPQFYIAVPKVSSETVGQSKDNFVWTIAFGELTCSRHPFPP